MFIDYYELLQVSPNADEDTIQRIFRHLAKKYHPDAPSTGDSERFNLLLEAYRTLTDVEVRAAYDVSYQRHWNQRWRVAVEASTAPLVKGDDDVRRRLLSLLYVQRRRDPRSPGMGELDLERLMELPAELLAFHLWYFREKGLIQRTDTGHIAITADGVDHVEQDELRPPDRLLESRSDLHEGDGDVPGAASPSKTGTS